MLLLEIECVQIEEERQQLVQTWVDVLKKRPTLLEKPIASLKRLLDGDDSKRGGDFRTVHDWLGLVAKDHKECKGAIYRTDGFIRIPKSNLSKGNLSTGKRCGVKKQCPLHAGLERVHIEHTVQIIALYKGWKEISQPMSEHDFISYLLRHSVSTAMARGEERGLPSLKVLPEKPFDRYLGRENLKVWNVFDGVVVPLDEWTFDDHQDVIERVIEEARATLMAETTPPDLR